MLKLEKISYGNGKSCTFAKKIGEVHPNELIWK